MADAGEQKIKTKKQLKGYVPNDYKDNDDILEYIEVKLRIYTKYNIGDESLWEYYKEDFKDFKVDDFKRLGPAGQQTLRKYLRCGGVYIAQAGSRVLLAHVLYNTLCE